MIRIANRDMRRAVERRQEFKGSNTFGKWKGNTVYAVYSYGDHFPMVVFDDTTMRWFHNEDKYSASTSRHQSQSSRPGEPKSTEALQRIIAHGGVAGAITNMLERA